MWHKLSTNKDKIIGVLVSKHLENTARSGNAQAITFAKSEIEHEG